MSEYGADPTPATGKLRQVFYGYFLGNYQFCQSDQFTIDSNNHVFKFNDGTNRVKLKVLVNPNDVYG